MIEPLVRAALLEDLGRGGDLTTDLLIPEDRTAEARLVAREAGTVAGLAVVALTFHLMDARVLCHSAVRDGTTVEAGTVALRVAGPARALLSAERVALNFFGRLSGIATATAGLVATVAGTKARIACTRKTTPGLRALEKYAVRCGGGCNHRLGLDDAVLIKDNHVALAGGVAEALAQVRDGIGHMTKVQIEVDTLDQLDEALTAGADAVLFDNMPPDQLAEGVRRVGGRAITEASGGITPQTIAAVAATGVDLISVGWLTHSARSLDVGLDVVVEPGR